MRGLVLRDQHEIEAALVGVHGGAGDRQDDIDMTAALRRDRLVAAAELDQLDVEAVALEDAGLLGDPDIGQRRPLERADFQLLAAARAHRRRRDASAAAPTSGQRPNAFLSDAATWRSLLCGVVVSNAVRRCPARDKRG